MAMKVEDIKIDKPELIISVSSLTSIADIHRIMKAHGIDNYTYVFKCQGKTMKIGHSADSSHSYGERITRQIGNLPGMPARWSSCGKDMIEVVKAFERETKIKVHPSDVTVEIWNVSDINNPSIERDRYVAECAEDTLFDQYEERYGKLPPGNPKDTRRSKGGRTTIMQDTWDATFEFV